MAWTRSQLTRLLHDRHVFALAQQSYRRHVLRSPPQGEFSARAAAILADHPPYPTIAAELLPRVQFWATVWEQLTRRTSAQRRPLLRYVAALCPHPAHTEKQGLIYPLAHPFWDEWLPPSSYPCRCVVMSVSLSLFAQRWATEGAEEWRIEVPRSALRYPRPDRGFRFNPGALGLSAGAKLYDKQTHNARRHGRLLSTAHFVGEGGEASTNDGT
jgi:hypothetical protein